MRAGSYPNHSCACRVIVLGWLKLWVGKALLALVTMHLVILRSLDQQHAIISNPPILQAACHSYGLMPLFIVEDDLVLDESDSRSIEELKTNIQEIVKNSSRWRWTSYYTSLVDSLLKIVFTSGLLWNTLMDYMSSIQVFLLIKEYDTKPWKLEEVDTLLAL